MDFESLKDKWRSMPIDDTKLEHESDCLMSKLRAGKISSSQQTLAEYYTRNGIIGLALPALAPMLVTVLELPVWVAAVYGLFGLIMSILNFRIGRIVRRDNYISLPVVTALARVIHVRRTTIRTRAFGIALGLVVVASMAAYIFDRNEYAILAGMAVGIVFGAIIGCKKYRDNMRVLDDLIRELRDLNDE